MNALKHGLRSAAVLLPGDDLSDFLQRRHELFEEFNPCTRGEADCVEQIVGYKWKIERCQILEARFHAALNQVVGLYPEAEHICEPDPHRWQHRTMDCTLEEARLNRLLTAQLRTLFLLQKMRRDRLIDGAILVAKHYRDFLGDEMALTEPASADSAAGETVIGPTGERPVTPSADRPNRKYHEREPAGRVAGLGAEWVVVPGVPLAPASGAKWMGSGTSNHP